MPALDHVLSPYLPRLQREWVAASPSSNVKEVEGSLVLIDISGFTRLSERLARLGKAGAEEVSGAIAACFTRLLAIAYGDGGSLLKFGGDAMLLLFDGSDHAPRACRAAVGMRAALRSVGRIETPAGRICLRMSAGVHSGSVQLFLVGSSHRELIVAGPAVTAVVKMEQEASAGQIVVSADCATHLPPVALGAVAGAGMLLRRAPSGLSPHDVVESVPTDTQLQDYVPLALRTHLMAGLHDPEHRQVTVAFVEFTQTDDAIARLGPRRAARRLDALVAAVQHSVDRHGLTFLGSDVAADGGKIIIVAGAPAATGDEDARMLSALREIADRRLALPVRIGVHRGRVFAGDIGPPYRRTYTVMGDAVNLAARVMAHAPAGQILATPEVVEQSSRLFVTGKHPPFHAKGKRHPVRALVVGRPRGVRVDADVVLPLKGRATELRVLLQAMARARSGRGQVVELVGPAGIGKSRLVSELRSRAHGVRQVRVVCHRYGSETPYGPFRQPLRRLLQIDERTPPRRAGQELVAVLRQDAAHLLPWAPLLAPLIGAEVEESAEVAQLDNRFRRARLHEAALALLTAQLDGPTLLEVEDAHWMDEASAQLWGHVASHIGTRPWLLCVTRRDASRDLMAGGGRHLTTIALTPLATAAAAALATAATADAPLPGHEVQELAERSGGNPLLLRELVTAARQTGNAGDLPASVEALMAARIDRLPSADRTTLRQLAVLGATFERSLAEQVLSRTGGVDLTRLDEFVSEDEGVVAFRHALIRDAAYEGLAYRTRRKLHAVAGAVIAEAHEAELPGREELLSFHFFHAQQFAKAWHHSVLAAQQAAGIYANATAAELYGRALSAARHVDTLSELQIGQVWEALGDVRDRMGAYAQAAEAYRAGRRARADDPVADARLMLKLAWEQGWLRRYSQSLRWIRRGLDALADVRSDAAAGLRAQFMVWYGHFLQEQGRHPHAIARCREGIAAAQHAGELEALAHGYRTLDWAYVALGEIDLAVYSPRALAIYEDLGDLPGQAAVLHNMASIAYLQGRWDDALTANVRAREIWTRIGDDVSVAFSLANTAEVLFDQGRVLESETMLREVLRVSVAAGHRALAAFARRHLGRVTAHAGDHTGALDLLETALAEYLDLGARVEVIETQVRIADAHLLNADPETALLIADQALEGARGLGGVAAQLPPIHRVRGYALLALRDHEPARSAFEAALRAARARDATFEVAMSLRALSVWGDIDGDSAATGLRADSDELLRGLGVVAVAEVPLRAGCVGAGRRGVVGS